MNASRETRVRSMVEKTVSHNNNAGMLAPTVVGVTATRMAPNTALQRYAHFFLFQPNQKNTPYGTRIMKLSSM